MYEYVSVTTFSKAWDQPWKMVLSVRKYAPMGATIIARVKPNSLNTTALKENCRQPHVFDAVGQLIEQQNDHPRRDCRTNV